MLGLIAGEGAFPIEIARAVRAAGRPLHAVAFPELTDPMLSDHASSIDWLPLGAMRPLLDSLHSAGAEHVVMAGKVDKTHLHRPGVPVAPDAEALALLARLHDKADGQLLQGIADLLEREGFELRPQAEWVPGWVAGVGLLGCVAPTERQQADLDLGAPIARTLAGLDVGQCVVVEGGTVLAVEAIDGTDATIERAGHLGAGDGVLVKLARPVQDPRFDWPAVGARTLDAMAAAGLRTLGIEAGRTIVIGGDAFYTHADALGIAVVGIAVSVSTSSQTLPAPSSPTSSSPSLPVDTSGSETSS